MHLKVSLYVPCSPQMAMDPMPMSDIAPLVRDHAAEFHGIQGWPATPKLVPTVIVCESQSSMAVLVQQPMLLLEPVKNGLRSLTVLAMHMVGCSAFEE